MGAEDYSGQNDIQTRRCHAYAAADRSETEKLNDLCSSSGFEFQKSRLYENSDLRSKWNTSTAYILADDSEQVRLLK